jgi:nicotinamide-nucleotide amidase
LWLQFEPVPNQSSAASLLVALEEQGLSLAIAESLTGGLLSSTFVEVPGASRVLLGSIVAYHSDLKNQLLGVSRALIQEQGAVDPEMVAQMAAGVRAKLANATGKDVEKVVGLATTGVAGPDPQDGKAVGTVFVGISAHFGDYVYPFEFSGDRQEIRAMAVSAAINSLGEHFN